MVMGLWGGQFCFCAQVANHNPLINKNDPILLGLDSICRLFVKFLNHLHNALNKKPMKNEPQMFNLCEIGFLWPN